MSVLADHIAALILHRAGMESDGRWGAFITDIADDFANRCAITVPNGLISAACARIDKLGGCTILPSPITGDMYLINTTGAFHFFEPNSAPDENSSIQYDNRWADANENYPAIRAYYHGKEAWASKAIAALKTHNLAADDSGALERSEFAPASDRIVTLDHNSSQLAELVDGIEELQEAVRVDNSDRIVNPADKGRFMEQLGSAKRLLKLENLSLKALSALVLPVLTYLSIKFADEAIGELAATLLQLIKDLFGIVF